MKSPYGAARASRGESKSFTKKLGIQRAFFSHKADGDHGNVRFRETRLTATGRGCVKTHRQNEFGGHPTITRCHRMQYSASWQADLSDIESFRVIPESSRFESSHHEQLTRPCSARWVSMNATITSVGARVPLEALAAQSYRIGGVGDVNVFVEKACLTRSAAEAWLGA